MPLQEAQDYTAGEEGVNELQTRIAGRNDTGLQSGLLPEVFGSYVEGFPQGLCLKQGKLRCSFHPSHKAEEPGFACHRHLLLQGAAAALLLNRRIHRA